MSAPKDRRTARTSAAQPARPRGLRPEQALALPLAFTALLFALGLLPAIRQSQTLFWSFWGAGGVLLAWTAVILATARSRGRTFTVEVALRKQHYLQACAQFCVLLYWGAYWRQVYDSALLLIAAQLLFAYAVDALLTWSRHDDYVFGFGPFPIVFSTNLFLWFKADWFYLQFLMLAVGFAAKQLIRWTKDGRPAHIFNPSSFPLAVFSAVLILTGATQMTWGQDIAATQFNPPHIYLLIFLVALPGQFLFGVASMTASAVATAYLTGMAYAAVTGTNLFLEPPIPIAVFLGMHLLFTDPSTSPRTELGRVIFGVLYGSSVVALLALLPRLGIPTFYDKLLPVPILNLMIRGIDRAARSTLVAWIDPARLTARLTPRQRNLAYMTVWIAIFASLQAATGAQATLARGDSLMTQGRMDEAVERYREFVQAEPADFEGHDKLGFALMQTGQSDDAVATIRRAIVLQPANPEAHSNLGIALMQTGRFDEAIAALRRAVELRPAYAEAHYNLANALMNAGQAGAAVGEFRETLRQRPDWPEALASLAWLEATEGEPIRNPQDAVQLAERAAASSRRQDAQVLDVLGASYAAAGRFEDAIRTAIEAEARASGSPPDLAAQIRAHASLYRAGQSITSGR